MGVLRDGKAGCGWDGDEKLGEAGGDGVLAVFANELGTLSG